MTVTLFDLRGASNGPAGRPAMLTVGDSIMWGQGLRPEHRFRELVRQRVEADWEAPVVELAMARSGAKLHPERNPPSGDLDNGIARSLHDGPPVDRFYEPDAFTREFPYFSLTTIRQLEEVYKVLISDHDHGHPAEIRLILLDGGINDLGIVGILTPFIAWSKGYFLSNWTAWIRDETQHVEDEMVETLNRALDRFPNAVIVVTGYYPVFSFYSAAHLYRIQSVGILHAITDTVLFGLLGPFGLDSIVAASNTWQAASNHYIRSAIRRTIRDGHQDRTILFARSHIEGTHCLFGPNSWLWGYDRIPDREPRSQDEWIQLLASATPEDEVIPERLAVCDTLATDATARIECRLASIGHPNRAGALDYSASIIEVLEDAGVIRSNQDRCGIGRRQRQAGCAVLNDEMGYGCVTIESTIGEGCRNATNALGNAAERQFQAAGDRLQRGGERLASIPDCFNQNQADLQTCDNTCDADVQQCHADNAIRLAGCDTIQCMALADCDTIQCTDFTNCDSFGRFDPRRYACWAARAVCVVAMETARLACWAARGACVAAATIARDACIAGSLVILAGCIAAADVRQAACRLAILAREAACAIGRVAQASIDVIIGTGHVLAGTALGITAGITIVACTVGTWFVSRGCQLGTALTVGVCKLSAAAIDIGCWISMAGSRLFGSSR